MAFRAFKYHPQAEQGLSELMARGEETFAELKREIRAVLVSWRPEEDEEEPTLIVPFEDYYLIFTVAREDPSILILAAVDRQPEF